MALLTVTEAKAILNITVSTWDTQLGILLPFVQDQVVFSLTQNTFSHPTIRMLSTTLTFSNSGLTIIDSDAQFVINNFRTGLDILVSGSLYNNTLLEIDTLTAGTLTCTFVNLVNQALVDEAEGEAITIKALEFPKNLKLTTARWLNYLIQKDNLKGIKSESVMSYSVQYLNEMPKQIKDEFASYKKLSWT